MKKLATALLLATILTIPAKLFSASVSVEVETKTAEPGQSLYLKVLLHTDTPISALRIPITMENPWITLDRVSWEYTVATGGFFDTTFLADDNRTDALNILPDFISPLPTIDPPGGELCRFYITVDPFAPEQFVRIDSLNQEHNFVDASNPYGTSIRPDFIAGGIEVQDQSTAVDDLETALPESYQLDQNYPNPFNPTTQIAFTLPKPAQVDLRVYDILGRVVATLANGLFQPGRHTLEWNASGNPSGVYFYRLTTPEFSSTRKMLLIQ